MGNWFTFNSISLIDSNSVYVVGTGCSSLSLGSGGILLKTINGGTDWTTMSIGVSNGLYSIFFTDANTGFAVGGDGTILKITDGGITFIERNNEKAILNEFILEQSYPNPFNPSTMIKYSLPFESKVVIKIYNVLGQDVKLLKDEIISAGNHEVQFNSSSLSSGVYFYRLSAVSLDGKQKYSAIKKMILLK